MCILFLYTSNSLVSKFRLVLATNRDESFDRPSQVARFWTEFDSHIFGGRDLIKGGTWLALSTKNLSDSGIILRIGIVLNINGEQNPLGAESRGSLIINYLKGEKSAADYLNQLDGDGAIYAAYNLVLIEVKADDIFVHHKSNVGDLQTQTASGEQVLSFGNSPVRGPYVKVKMGCEEFLEIVHCFNTGFLKTKEDFIEELLKLLKSEKRYLPDEELCKRVPNNALFSSSIFVNYPNLRYGTRTHSIILLDFNNRLEFIEQTMQDPVAEAPQWVRNNNEFVL